MSDTPEGELVGEGDAFVLEDEDGCAARTRHEAAARGRVEIELKIATAPTFTQTRRPSVGRAEAA